MNQKFYSLFLFLATLSTIASAQGNMVTIQDGDLQEGQTYNWTKDNVYMLDGFVFLEAGGVLNIEAGAVIKGKAAPTTGDNASALIITRDAKIIAEGTAAEPIIFTAELDDVAIPDDLTQDDRGLWGGLLLLGNGVVGRPEGEGQIEGIPSDEARARYGGADDADNSGILKYVSIRHGGAELAPGDEINGLTLGGVGNGTTIEFVEIFANQDDGIEWFGGAVDVKNLVVAFCGDDGTDWDEGYRGRGQYWFVIQDPINAGNGGEHDGANPDGQDPFSNPTVYNATYIGSGVGAAADNEFALLLRDRTGGTYANSIFTDFANEAISVEDLPTVDGDDSFTNLQNGDLVLKNNIWWGFGAGSTLDDIVDTYPDGDDPDASEVKAHLVNNNNSLADPMLCGISRSANGMLDPRVEVGSPAASGAIEVPATDFFDPVDYRGAFGTGANPNWAMGWSALATMGYLGDVCLETDIEDLVTMEHGYRLMQNSPNPVWNQTKVSYYLPQASLVNLAVYDLHGRMVKQLIRNQRLGEGEYNLEFGVNNLPKGMYLIRMEAGNVGMTRKMIVVR